MSVADKRKAAFQYKRIQSKPNDKSIIPRELILDCRHILVDREHVLQAAETSDSSLSLPAFAAAASFTRSTRKGAGWRMKVDVDIITNQSMDEIALLLPSVSLGDRNEVVCRGNRLPRSKCSVDSQRL